MIQLECYHGTSYENALSILDDNNFLPSRDREGLRLGEGAYFFCKWSSSDYAIECARQLMLHKHTKGKLVGEYAILSCIIECAEEQFFDMYDPAAMEYFHNMRHYLYNKHLQTDKDFQYVDAAAADTETMNYIRRSADIAVVRCPQFFGMFPREENFAFSGRHKYPKTYVPNIIQVCVDTEKATIRDIQLIGKGAF